MRVGAGTTGDGEGIASSSSMGWSSRVSLSARMMASSYPLFRAVHMVLTWSHPPPLANAYIRRSTTKDSTKTWMIVFDH